MWVSLDPARGAEVPKTRPCVVVSRTEANDISSTVTVVPLSSVKGRAAERLVQPLLSAKDTRLPAQGLTCPLRPNENHRQGKDPRKRWSFGRRIVGENRSKNYGSGTLLTSWTRFSSGSSKLQRSRFPLAERSWQPLFRNSPRARELSSFSPQATAPDDSRFGVPLEIRRSSCILRPPRARRNDFPCSLRVAAAPVHPPP